MPTASFQTRVQEWLSACFPETVSSDKQERTHRFLEEALELAQASGCTREDAQALVEYVFSRPHGQTELEVGGVLVTLAGLCSVTNVHMQRAAEQELERNWQRINLIREKQASKPNRSPLPQ